MLSIYIADRFESLSTETDSIFVEAAVIIAVSEENARKAMFNLEAHTSGNDFSTDWINSDFTSFQKIGVADAAQLENDVVLVSYGNM